MEKRIVIATGGTGGHIFPATALAKDLLNSENPELLFLGGKLSQNPYFNREEFDSADIPAATLSFKKPLAAFQAGRMILQGILKSRTILKKFSPDLIVGFGSYYSLPVLAAGLTLKIPIILHEQNATPGKVNRLFSPFAKRTAITFPESEKFLKGFCAPTAFPLRFSFSSHLKEEALKYFSLSQNCLTILIVGGSQGAKSINALAYKALAGLREELPPFQVIHLTGREGCERRWEDLEIKACVKPFETRMDLAWIAADLAIARGGASSLSEQIASLTPGIIIPYPYATDNHQEKNALYFVNEISGGILFNEKKGDEKDLSRVICRIVKEVDRFKMNIRDHLEKTRLPTLRELILENI